MEDRLWRRGSRIRPAIQGRNAERLFRRRHERVLRLHELYKPELCFLPIGDLYTMSPHEAALACRLLKPKTVIPMHFGTFPPLIGRPSELAALTAGLCEVKDLAPGIPFVH